MLGLLAATISIAPIWAPKGVADDADSQVAFRGTFNANRPEKLRILGASEYLVWLDGKLIHDGPARYPKAFPESQEVPLFIGAGRHILAVQVRNDGVTTRILSDIPPFLWCELQTGTPIDWKCARLAGYRPRVHRISDILGWIDWCDTNQIPLNWQQPHFDDSRWQTPVVTDPGIGEVKEAKTKPVRNYRVSVKPIAEGKLTSNYGYEQDEPAARFFLDDLDPKDVPPQGVWRRYDLGRVRLGRPNFTLDVPRGSIVEFAQCEQLRHGRVHAWITLSGSATCNLDHFVARGGPQDFMPFTPKGGRYLEVHVRASGPVKFLKEEFLERTYYPEPIGTFDCDDPLLNKIWRTGVETMRACSEDSFVDCPTRERGQWTGDVASVATDIAAVAYGDLSLSRRALVQAAQAARADGLVAGVGPGDPGYLSTYAAQWVTACVHYWELTGDKSLLEELRTAAERNVNAFDARMTQGGVSDSLGWAFVDWGYVRNEGATDMALNLHYLMALRAMVRWENALSSDRRSRDYAEMARKLETTISTWLTERLATPGKWEAVGYHRAALALLTGLVPKAEEKACIQSIEHHLLTCFPNDPSAPRLTDPSVANDRLMTPYFCHFALTALLDRGETGFVLNQYRKCWGWALAQGLTTTPEVFDLRWSLCHEWSACPTWQLSRYVLGLRPRFDLGDSVYEVDVRAGSLKRASGVIPMPSGGTIRVSWTRVASRVNFVLVTSQPIRVRIGRKEVLVQSRLDTSLAG